MQYQMVGNNPFAVLTAIVAPAILTNACSVLSLGTSNRLGRVVDRTRVVAGDIAASKPGSEEFVGWKAQLDSLEMRVQMLLLALRLFYAALGLFSSSALISVVGSVSAFYGQRLIFQVGAVLAVLTGGSAVIGLTAGCYFMVNETRLAVKSLVEESRMRIRLHDVSKSD
jgi:Protein of unknown function (DUF2721)